MRHVLVTIQYDVDPAKRDAYLAHAREMREHAVDALKLPYQIYEDLEHANRFVEIFTCASIDEYESFEDRQDDRFRDLVARLDRFTDLQQVRYSAIQPLP